MCIKINTVLFGMVMDKDVEEDDKRMKDCVMEDMWVKGENERVVEVSRRTTVLLTLHRVG